MTNFPISYWFIFVLTICLVILLDLRINSKGEGGNAPLKLLMVVLSIALIITILLYIKDKRYAIDFVNGYLVELSLSIDNVFVFLMVLNYFQISQDGQNKVLFIGIISALLMRFLLIVFCTHLVMKFYWIFYVFAALLVYGAFHIIKNDDSNISNIYDGWMVRLLQKIIRVDKTNESNTFFTFDKNGKISVTKLFIALITIEKIDLIFAIDSVPAVLAITREPFIVFSSSILAITGLRSMYLIFINFLAKSNAMRYGAAAIMVLIATKMILEVYGIHVHQSYFMAIVAMILFLSLTYQAITSRKKKGR